MKRSLKVWEGLGERLSDVTSIAYPVTLNKSRLLATQVTQSVKQETSNLSPNFPVIRSVCSTLM